MQKYQDGDCRRIGPGYKRFQRSSRHREEMRGVMTEEVKKDGFLSLVAFLFAQKLLSKVLPKHPWRSAAHKGHTRAREAKRLAERAEKQGSNV